MEESYCYKENIDDGNPLAGKKDGSYFKDTVEIIKGIYNKEESGYGVYSVATAPDTIPFTMSGIFTKILIPGRKYNISGKIEFYKGSPQVHCISCDKVSCDANDEMIDEILCLDLGAACYAKDIVKEFGDKAKMIIKTNPKLLSEKIKGITAEEAFELQKKVLLSDEADYSEELLRSYGFNNYEIKKLISCYGLSIGDYLKEDPYFLIGKNEKFDFSKCDEIAINNSIEFDNIKRIEAGIMYAFKNAENNRDCYMNQNELIQAAKHILSYYISYKAAYDLFESGKDGFEIGKTVVPIKKEHVRAFIEKYKGLKAQERKKKQYALYYPDSKIILNVVNLLIDNNRLKKIEVSQKGENKKREFSLYLPQYYEAENVISEKIVALCKNKKRRKENIIENLIKYLKSQQIILENDQMEAVVNILSYDSGLFIITGGPGTGKTFILKIILNVLKSLNPVAFMAMPPTLMAPTGRAAQVLGSTVDLPSSTIHKTIGLTKEDIPQLNSSNPLPSEVIIVDECSMLDMMLGGYLFDAISKNSLVIMVGDADQLPAIGAGNVFKDIIDSQIAPVFNLPTVKRQAKYSSIISNSKKILEGKMITTNSDRGDSLIIRADDPEELFVKIKSIYSRLIKGGTYDVSDVQILSPNRIGGAGSESLNMYIQSFVNPYSEDIKQAQVKEVAYYDLNKEKMAKGTMYYRVGDKVMNIVNDYTKVRYVKTGKEGYETTWGTGVFNGEIGEIVDIVSEKEYGRDVEKVIVQYGDQYVYYKNLYELELAYAITIHKSQGSQWPVVIIPIMQQSLTMLTRSLLYTAFTRASSIVVVVGQREAIAYAIENEDRKEANSNLRVFLRREQIGK